ncbi:hypothetical protein [Fusobacterium sp. SYSU M8D902]|uniref:TraG/VirB4 family ATPase n=1 Tax=Fusobacterium sp. SYSU M8D902 TaxID=3159562 RepID=UPI0032E3F475
MIYIYMILFVVFIVFLFKLETEYDPKNKNRTVDYLPWIILNKDGIITNKNGSITKIFKYKCDDMEHLSNYFLFRYRDHINNILKRLDEKWVVQVDSIRKVSNKYPNSKFKNKILNELDKSRKEKYLGGNYYESENYISLTYFPPKDKENKLENLFYKNIENKDQLEGILEKYFSELNIVINLLKEHFISLEELTPDETVTFLHSCITGNDKKLKYIPGKLLDYYISDVDIIPNNEPVKIGNKYLAVIGILSHIAEHPCGLFDELSRLGIEYRINHRFIYISDKEGIKISEDYEKAYNNERKSFIASMKEEAMKEEVIGESEYALAMKEEARGLSNDLRKRSLKSGYYSFNVVLLDENKEKLKENIEKIMEEIDLLGFVSVNETVNCLETFFGTMAGDCINGLRKPLMTTYNLASLIPINMDWGGSSTNKFFKQNNYPSEALIYCQSGENSSFKLNLHIGDVGHTLVLGQTGGGKSVLLNTLAYQSQKYGARVVFFDNGGSSRVLTRAIGGKFNDIGNDKINFQPFRYIDKQSEMEWALEWVLSILEKEKYDYTANDKTLIAEALHNLSKNTPENRTMSVFALLVQKIEIRNILMIYTKQEKIGIYGEYFDNNKDDINDENLFQVFELEKIFDSKILDIFLDYLFHRVETELLSSKDGKVIPTFIFLDEFWRMLGTPKFRLKIKNWLKTLRKKHVAVIMATQSLSDVAKSEIKSALLESCPTKIYLTNPDLIPGSDTEQDYFSFGLNDVEIEMIRTAQAKRDYYLKSEGGKMINLDLSKLELAYVGSSSPSDQKVCEKLYKEAKDLDEFNKNWREYKNV